jgi:hypothetical protein
VIHMMADVLLRPGCGLNPRFDAVLTARGTRCGAELRLVLRLASRLGMAMGRGLGHRRPAGAWLDRLRLGTSAGEDVLLVPRTMERGEGPIDAIPLPVVDSSRDPATVSKSFGFTARASRVAPSRRNPPGQRGMSGRPSRGVFTAASPTPWVRARYCSRSCEGSSGSDRCCSSRSQLSPARVSDST